METREKEKWREGKIERTWKLKKNSGREEPGICGGEGSLFIITVFRVLNVGKGRMLEIKIGVYRSKN